MSGKAERIVPTSLADFIRGMPKVELHVHLEGSIRPETLLELARRNQITLPARTVEELSEWYAFRDFAHFIEIYVAISRCLRTPDDLELIAREFLRGQAVQNVRHSEVTFTPYTHYTLNRIEFADQLAAINRARVWAETELGVTMGMVTDISRNSQPTEHSLLVADWAISAKDNGVVAFGLGGPEMGYPPEMFEEAFAKTRTAGLPAAPHAGETVGPESIWGALDSLRAVRLGHGVRCLEDAKLVEHLRERQIPLEVCPTSNLCLGVASSIADHPLPKLLAEGLYVTINSDDPPMFNTTLTDEYLKVAEIFGFEDQLLEGLVMNALRASFLPADRKAEMELQFRAEFDKLRGEEGSQVQ